MPDIDLATASQAVTALVAACFGLWKAVAGVISLFKRK